MMPLGRATDGGKTAADGPDPTHVPGICAMVVNSACHTDGVSFSRLAENRIREAMEQGKFADLSGVGQRIDLEAYFSTPEDLRMAYSILKNANCVPVEVELLKELARLEQAVAEAGDPAARRALQRELMHRRTELAIAIERSQRRSTSPR
jgi:hypothetical protein